jgi:hypothetical protein
MKQVVFSSLQSNYACVAAVLKEDELRTQIDAALDRDYNPFCLCALGGAMDDIFQEWSRRKTL